VVAWPSPVVELTDGPESLSVELDDPDELDDPAEAVAVGLVEVEVVAVLLEPRSARVSA
jgi:hypothetical protein